MSKSDPSPYYFTRMINVEYQKKAIDWLNSKRDFDEGLAVLRDSGFRPGVTQTLTRKGKEMKGAMEHLTHNIRMLIRAYGDAILEEDTDAEIGVFNGEESPADTPAIEAKSGILSEVDLGGNIGVLIRKYADLYKRREVAFRKLKEMGDANDDATCEKRKQLNQEIEESTDMMERIYPHYKLYKSDGIQPSDEDLSSMENEDKEEDQEKNADEDYDAMSKEELTKLSYSTQRKIKRAQNMLEYQCENELDSPNPMPTGPRRVKYETKINKLKPVHEAMLYALAKK